MKLNKKHWGSFVFHENMTNSQKIILKFLLMHFSKKSCNAGALSTTLYSIVKCNVLPEASKDLPCVYIVCCTCNVYTRNALFWNSEKNIVITVKLGYNEFYGTINICSL
jgi:hypothetical protein